MSLKLLAFPLLIPASWNLYTTFRGISDFFDLPTNPGINPGQFAFGIVITVIVVGFVITSWAIFNSGNSVPAQLLQLGSIVCIVVDAAASWLGTKRIISFEDGDPGKLFGLALVIVLIVLSKIALSWVLFDQNVK